MKNLLVCLVAIAFLSSPSEAFLLDSVVDGVSNFVNGATNVVQSGVNTVVSSVSNTVSNVQNAINIALLGGQFLWANAVSPSLQVLQNNGANFIDNYFGNLLNNNLLSVIGGKRNVIAIQAIKQLALSLYMAESNKLFQSLKDIIKQSFDQLVSELRSSFGKIILGQVTIQEIIKPIFESTKEEIKNQLKASIQSVIAQLTSNANMAGLVAVFGNVFADAGTLVTNTFNTFMSERFPWLN